MISSAALMLLLYYRISCLLKGHTNGMNSTKDGIVRNPRAVSDQPRSPIWSTDTFYSMNKCDVNRQHGCGTWQKLPNRPDGCQTSCPTRNKKRMEALYRVISIRTKNRQILITLTSERKELHDQGFALKFHCSLYRYCLTRANCSC